MKLLLQSAICAIVLTSCERISQSDIIDDGVPPVPPSIVDVYYASDGEIGVEWNRVAESGIKKYNIYKGVNDSTHLIFLDFTTNNYFTESYLEYDSVYFYAVTSVDVFDEESIYSQIVSARPENRYRPYPPFNVEINARNWNDSISIVLNWYPPADTDIKGYEIYRDQMENFDVENILPVGYSPVNSFTDNCKLRLLTSYYYKIVTVDKGNLKSTPTQSVNDLIHDTPVLVYPTDGQVLKSDFDFEFNTISVPSDYKLIIQRNEFFDVIYEKIFSSSSSGRQISVSAQPAVFELYKKYYWRIITYSKGYSTPNSFSEIRSFTIAER
ncbi:MAG: hypothetical protein JW995_11010 [Melioribacteraceae bacterium]|nr:hypothetical protein [Melioribacteraceae bacterium]